MLGHLLHYKAKHFQHSFIPRKGEMGGHHYRLRQQIFNIATILLLLKENNQLRIQKMWNARSFTVFILKHKAPPFKCPVRWTLTTDEMSESNMPWHLKQPIWREFKHFCWQSPESKKCLSAMLKQENESHCPWLNVKSLSYQRLGSE